MIRMVRLAVCLAFVVFLTGCDGKETPSSSPTASASPSSTIEPTVTDTAIPPTSTQELTVSPTPAATSTPATGLTGVSGVALVGPSCPVETEDEPCPDRPWQGPIVAKTLNGSEVARTESDAAGHFELPLPPGEYEIIAELAGFLPAPISLYVTLASGEWKEIEVMLDSGIR
jgi:hypothetical protein